MSKRKHLGRSRALRPSAEGLEGRQLLSATVSGTDTAGDRWTLRLSGRGSLQVLKQDDASGNPAALNSASEIRSITISGSDPTSTRLVGTVTPAAGSSGRVFFQELTEQTNRSLKTGTGLGILAIDMPDFYLGDTSPTASTATGRPTAEINIPDGINSLRFGGVDTTASFGTDPTQSPSQDGRNDQFLVRLGIPVAIGTSVVVNQITSSDQAAVASTTAGRPNSPTQKSVVFEVFGRLDLFQANQINGSTDFAPAPASFSGGTIVSSFSDPSSGITGEIGFVRVGGNATNLSVVTNNLLANMYVGGETNNVAVLAPNGARSFHFGRGMDTTTILTHTIENIAANRGILNSRVVTDRQIGDIMSGGDVVNSTILSGYVQGLANVAGSVEQNISSPSAAQAVTVPTPTAQANGQITAFVSGDVTNSVFAASDQPVSQLVTPTNQTFGGTQDAFLPLGRITARVEGAINNASATPDSPTTAFYAQKVKLTRGPVSPPHVVEPPLPLPARPISLPGIPRVFPKVNGKLMVHTTRPIDPASRSGFGSP